MLKKLFILSLCFFALFGYFLISAETPSFAIGEVESHETIVVEDITYNKYVLTTPSPEYHIVHNLELGRYSDFQVVLHDRLYGPDAVGKATVLEIALDYEAKTGKTVYAAVNGDFFSTLPIDFYAVENNILRIGYYDKNAFGFTNAHKSIVGKVEWGFKVNVYDASGQFVDYVHLDQMNASLNAGEIGVYTPDVSSQITGTDIAKISVENELIPNNSEYHYEGDILTNLDNVSYDDQTYTLTSDEFVIAGKSDSEGFTKLMTMLESDMRLAIYPYPINDWEGMDYIIGGWQILLDRNSLLPEPIHGSPTAIHPRTTIGVKRDGTLGLTVVDGRMVNVPGVTLEQLALLNQDLGYYNALELDGGGSSTVLLRNLDTDTLEIMNTPSDGYLRSVVNAVLIVGDPIPQVETTTTEAITTTDTTTTEPITTTMTTTEASTTSTLTTEEMTTEITTTISQTNQETTSQTTTTQTSSTTPDFSRQGCSGCSELNGSMLLFGLMTFLSFFFLRKYR